MQSFFPSRSSPFPSLFNLWKGNCWFLYLFWQARNLIIHTWGNLNFIKSNPEAIKNLMWVLYRKKHICILGLSLNCLRIRWEPSTIFNWLVSSGSFSQVLHDHRLPGFKSWLYTLLAISKLFNCVCLVVTMYKLGIIRVYLSYGGCKD